MTTSKSLALAVILFAVGCGEPYKPTVTSDEFPSPWKAVLNQLVEQAPFDLGCSIEQLTFKKLANSTSAVGVLGCGKRATYKYVNGVGWVLNAASVEGDGTVVTDSQPAPSSESSD